MSNPDYRTSQLPGLLSAALAAVAFSAAIAGVTQEIPSLGLIAAAIACVLAAVVVWLGKSNGHLTNLLDDKEQQLAATPPAAQESSASEDLGDGASAEPGGTAQRDKGQEMGALGIADTSDLADPETGLLGERYFVVTLEARVAAARRHLRPLALILLEAVDGAAVDASPIDANIAADAIRETLRDADTLCRLQSGRFAILLEDTPENGGIWTVERVRRHLGEQLEDVTVWAGIACYPANGFDGPEVLDRARQALTQAREWRQDRTEVAET